MFVVRTKTLVIEALQATFDTEYPMSEFRNLWVSMEYPQEQANWPGLWVDFTPTTDLQIAGINHQEHTAPYYEGEAKLATRWRFAGMITITVVAMTSLLRDRLVDEVIRIVAFGLQNPATSDFRSYMEGNDLIRLALQWDKIALGGKAESPGTPWGTDEIVYEMTITIDAQGEFLATDLEETEYGLISGIQLTMRPENAATEADEDTMLSPPTIPAVPWT